MGASPEILAVRAANQYRRRDIIGYLGLRYYLSNICTIRDRWSNEVATLLAQFNDNPVYHTSWHFKERNDTTNEIKYRRICLPVPNEIMAEAALIDACAKSGASFEAHSSVYSYRIAKGNESGGIYVPYYTGFQQRHKDIAKAARQYPKGQVVYTDLQKFYPSIKKEMAVEVWKRATETSSLPLHFAELGLKLIEGYSTNCNVSEKGILTGPMFSHLIANLVLRTVDEKMADVMPGGYFRYVDDITLVGEVDDVAHSECILNTLVGDLGFQINVDKRFETTAKQWLEGENDFSAESSRVSWKTVIGKLKQLLVARPELTDEITRQFNQNGFRIRPLNYSNAVKSQGYLKRMHYLMTKGWFRRYMHKANPTQLLMDAQTLRTRYTQEFWNWIKRKDETNKYDQKRRIHGLRRYASQLIFIADPDDLPAITKALFDVPEMELYAVVFDAVDRGDVSKLVYYGANAAHSAVYPLLATYETVECNADMNIEEVRQAVAIFNAYGLRIKIPDTLLLNDEMTVFCQWDSQVFDMGNGRKTFFAEVSRLHGLDCNCRHKELLFSAFDTREDMVTEISEFMNNSSPC